MRKQRILVLAVAVVLVAAFSFAVLQGWLKLPEKAEPKPDRYEVTVEGHNDTPFIATENGDRLVPEDKVPEVAFFNASVEPSNVSIPLHYRVKFRNSENATYTLMIPEIGIEQQVPRGEVFEPTFYKPCACAFWLKELGEGVNGTVFVD